MTSFEFKKIRIDLGFLQDQLAERMGMRQPHISRIESGSRKPTLQQGKHLLEIQRVEFLSKI